MTVTKMAEARDETNLALIVSLYSTLELSTGMPVLNVVRGIDGLAHSLHAQAYGRGEGRLNC